MQVEAKAKQYMKWSQVDCVRHGSIQAMITSLLLRSVMHMLYTTLTSGSTVHVIYHTIPQSHTQKA